MTMPTGLKFSVLLVGWIVAFSPVLPEMLDQWLYNTNNSHGLIVPFVTLYLIYKQKDKLLNTPVGSKGLGGLILAISMAIYIVSFVGSIAVVSRLMLVTSLIGLILYVLGDQIFKHIRFAILLLFLMIPVPESIYSMAAFPLQLFATKWSTYLVQSMGIPAYREGNMVYFLHAQLEVAEACSGLRSMMAFFTLSILLAHSMSKPGWTKTAILVLSTVPLAIGVNIIRVTGTGVLAHFYGEKIAVGFLHEFSGWFVFVLGFALLVCEYLIIKKFKSLD